MDINEVRSKLERLEDTICVYLFERAQYKLDEMTYKTGKIPLTALIDEPNFDGSIFRFKFIRAERDDDFLGRYKNPEERPFFIVPHNKPVVQRKVRDYGTNKVVNFNDRVLKAYFDCLPRLCEKGDDDEYGSAAGLDINCLQSLSRRIHLGEEVAQVKYEKEKDEYDKLIAANDIDGIKEKLRNRSVEQDNLARVRAKAQKYNISSEVVSEFFERVLMPMTIDVEVLYFMSKKTNFKDMQKIS